MPYNKTAQTGSAIHPPVGTLIDDGSLVLVEVLGVGGYGVVYRAEDTCSPSPKSYAVKCLVHSHLQPRQRQIHIREIALHQIASAHPNVVTLHRVVETYDYTYIIMDYAPDSDMFTQILHQRRYLGDNHLIKHVFLQLLDAVEYCHTLGIYHRDLKPENILCFDGGVRVAVTDFGLATTDKLSEEFRTGSIYHMSPECQGGEFAPTGSYSPMANDIWSLGIILLNLATGRNPWKSACLNDPTFQAYLRDPFGFIPSVLPISPEANAILVRMLDIDWRDRMSLPEIREAIEDITTFYSDGVIFEGSMARCPWESGMVIESCSTSSKSNSPVPSSQHADLKSHWSEDSDSEIVFASRSLTIESSFGVPWDEYSAGTTWAWEPQSTYHSDDKSGVFSVIQTESERSLLSPVTSTGPSMPSTPNSGTSFGDRVHRKSLTIDTNFTEARYYTGNVSMGSGSYLSNTSAMQTAVEYDPYGSGYYITSPLSAKTPMTVSTLEPTLIIDDRSMIDPHAIWDDSSESFSDDSFSRYSSLKSSVTSQDIREVPRSSAPSPDFRRWPQLSSDPIPIPPPRNSGIMFDHFTLSPISPQDTSPKKLSESTKNKSMSIFNHFHLFTKSSPASTTKSSPGPSPVDGEKTYTTQSFVPFDLLNHRSATESPTSPSAQSPRMNLNFFSLAENNGRPVGGGGPDLVSVKRVATQRSRRRAAYLRSPRHWFGTKLFASS